MVSLRCSATFSLVFPSLVIPAKAGIQFLSGASQAVLKCSGFLLPYGQSGRLSLLVQRKGNFYTYPRRGLRASCPSPTSRASSAVRAAPAARVVTKKAAEHRTRCFDPANQNPCASRPRRVRLSAHPCARNELARPSCAPSLRAFPPHPSPRHRERPRLGERILCRSNLHCQSFNVLPRQACMRATITA